MTVIKYHLKNKETIRYLYVNRDAIMIYGALYKVRVGF